MGVGWVECSQRVHDRSDLKFILFNLFPRGLAFSDASFSTIITKINTHFSGCVFFPSMCKKIKSNNFHGKKRLF